MDKINIKNIDLNLLKTFNVLMEERSVSRASERLNLSQSATSNALERIRESLDDRVLDREGRSMEPTRLALQLWPRIRSALNDIESALEDCRHFDPAGMEAHFNIAIDEYTMALLGRSLVQSIREKAPRVTLSFHIADGQSHGNQLAKGGIDIIVSPLWGKPPELEKQRLYDEQFIGLMAADHPLAGRQVTLQRYVKYPHVLVSARSMVGGNVDAGLRKTGLSRRVVTTTPWYESAPKLLAGSEYLLNMGERLGSELTTRYPLREFRIPIPVPGFTVYMLWHSRQALNVQHRWLRDQVERVLTV